MSDNLTVIKRNGDVVDFDPSKIKKAVTAAFDECSETTDDVGKIVVKVLNEIRNSGTTHVEDIQDIVEDAIMSFGYYDVAKAYIRYRYLHQLKRQTRNDATLLGMIRGDDKYWATENSNKNVNLVTVQRDYLAGITSTDLAKNYIFPKDVVEAHEAGIVHQHDMDYMAQSTLSNCFSADTEFVTSEGVKSFNDFYDGSPVVVRDKDGKWRSAVVHSFGNQTLYTVTLQSGTDKVEIHCTRNHRWVLNDGSVTENLQVGDILYPLPDVASGYEPKTTEEIKAFCYGFAISRGFKAADSRTMHVRLCARKDEGYIKLFEQAGYLINDAPNSDDVIAMTRGAFDRQAFLDAQAWKLMPADQKIALFNGYCAADGSMGCNAIHTCDERNLKLILDIAPVAGYYVSDVRCDTHSTPCEEDKPLYMITFRKKNGENDLWKVIDIRENCTKMYLDDVWHIDSSRQEVWCVTEPVTHTFTLANGIVTGNCELINLEDMLQNGTVINNVKINKPHRLSTAMTIATQIMASVAANTYGLKNI